MTVRDGKGAYNKKLTPDLWRGLHEHIKASEDFVKFLPQLYELMRVRCARFLKGHRLSPLVDRRDLFSEVLVKLMSTPTIASQTEVERFLAQNGPEHAIRRMAHWSTSPMPLLGLAQKIAGRRWEQPGSTEVQTEVADLQLSGCADTYARWSRQAQYLETYEHELCVRLGEHDREARLALRHILGLLAQNGLDRSDEPERSLGGFDELPFGAIRDLVNEELEASQWDYETARKACGRLATADRSVRRDAERAGFGTGPEALLGYLRHRIETQSQRGGGIVSPLVGEETRP